VKLELILYNMRMVILKNKGINMIGYDKFKDDGIGSINKCLKTDMLFLCLPTPYCSDRNNYNLDPINDVLSILSNLNYSGSIIVKSTVNPGTCEYFSITYSNLNIIHNPEFLTARNASRDFENQKHIVLGKTKSCSDDHFEKVSDFYKKIWPDAVISLCKSGESEIMKLGCNTSYAVKIQYLTELYLLCQKCNLDFESVKKMMLLNGDMGPNYTNVPGHDGSISYGGMCFPKDTNALCSYMKTNNLPCEVLNSTIQEKK
jgi:UDPglucose 6-dehydrogenase